MFHASSIANYRKRGSGGILGRFIPLFLIVVFSLSASLHADEKRLGIVFSSTTAANFYDEFAYSQLYISLQGQARMAGIPFDLLDEDDLTDGAKLSTYDALVIPLMTHVQGSKREAIMSALDQAILANGVGLVTSGSFLVFDEGGSYINSDALSRYLGLTWNNSNNGVAMTLNAAATSHPVMDEFEENEQVLAYDQIWLDSFVAVSGQTATTLATMNISGNQYNAVVATRLAGRNVHFANDQVLADSHIAWKAIQWVIFGDSTRVALKMGRMSNLFLGRNDMDQSMFAAQVSDVHVPLYGMLQDWKDEYDFVGSYYINVGDNQANGEYTNWFVSGPLYEDYIALGNEIGTHSYTHPHYTSQLSASELEFEFNQSKLVIEDQLSIDVKGTAIPGNPEGLAVDEIIDPYFEYISGQYGDIGSGYPLGIGHLRPDLQARYFGLNMSGDFSLIQFRGLSAYEAEQVWREEYLEQTRHTSQPVIHWLWHDYAPTVAGESLGYSEAMIENTIAFAANNGSEFVTVQDMNDRMDSFETASYSVSGVNPLQIDVAANDIGDFSLLVNNSQVISSVDAWYAYDEDQVFLPKDGGSFVIRLGATQDEVTRISQLPMHAELLSVSGNGADLDFSFVGYGEVKVTLNPALISTYSVGGADAHSLQGNVLTLSFNNSGNHVVAIRSGSGNLPPVASAQSVSVDQDVATAISLQGSDPEGAALAYNIVQVPSNGTLTGSGANRTYTPDLGFTGVDSFSYRVNDGEFNSNTAVVTINVAEVIINQAPSAQAETYQTNENVSVLVSLKVSDPDDDPLTYQVSQPANGALSGTAPSLIYTPNDGFTGADSFTFSVSDGDLTSGETTITINVDSGNSGEVSNLVASITLDGSLDDWSGLSAFPSDPDDISGEANLVDWRQVWLAHSDTDLFIAYRNDVDISLAWGLAIYFDSDNSVLTGYNDGLAMGVDYLLQGQFLYRYTGEGTSWSWEYVGSFTPGVLGKNAELSIPLSVLGYPTKLTFYLVGDNSAYVADGPVDFYPDTVYDATAAQRYFEYSTASVDSNSAPVANDQLVMIGQDEVVTIDLNASDVNGDSLQYEILSEPANGSLSNLTFPSVVYSPNADFVGTDQFTYRVNDGELESGIATVTINVSAATVDGPISNEVSTIAVDGVLDDWSELIPFPGDPDDVTGAANLIDWRQAIMAHSDTDLYLAYTNDVDISVSWGLAIYIDADASLATGFDNGTAVGAEYVIEGEDLYQYTGSGTDWSWQWLGQLTMAVQGQVAEMVIPKAVLGDPTNLRLIFIGNNISYEGGSTEDHYPDGLYDSAATQRYFEYSTGTSASTLNEGEGEEPGEEEGGSSGSVVVDSIQGSLGLINGIVSGIFGWY